MSQNQLLRDALIDGFTAVGIPGASINTARFSSAPQFGLLRRNPNAHEVSARLEIEARSEDRPQLLAAAADGREEDVMTQKACYEISLGIELRAVNFLHGNLQRQPQGIPLAPWNSPPIALVSQQLTPRMLLLPLHLME